MINLPFDGVFVDELRQTIEIRHIRRAKLNFVGEIQGFDIIANQGLHGRPIVLCILEILPTEFSCIAMENAANGSTVVHQFLWNALEAKRAVSDDDAHHRTDVLTPTLTHVPRKRTMFSEQ